VIKEVELQISDRAAKLERLGPTRASRDDQLNFLTDVREKFRERVYDGVEGHSTNAYYEEHWISVCELEYAFSMTNLNKTCRAMDTHFIYKT
jgi:hypothetical protein